MEKERTPAPQRDDLRQPDDVKSTQEPLTPDPNDEVPVPAAMYPSEIDERAQVVEALREEAHTNRDDELGLQP